MRNRGTDRANESSFFAAFCGKAVNSARDALNCREQKAAEMSFYCLGFVNKSQRLPTAAPSPVLRVARCWCRALGSARFSSGGVGRECSPQGKGRLL